MLFTPELRKHIDTGRYVVETESGDLVDVVNLVAYLWQKDATIVVKGMSESFGMSPKDGLFQ